MTRMTGGTEHDALLADGTVVRVRPIGPADAERLVRFHGRLSTETTYFRFFTVHPTLSQREVEHFTGVDHADREALVAVLEDEIIGVARYDRLKGTDDAEVAFVVEDHWQGHGVGTLLLEHLAALARDRGIKQLVADTLGNNRRMLNVFSSIRLPALRTHEAGVVHLTIPLASTNDAIDAVSEREQRAEAASVRRLLEPTSVAVVGASGRPGTVGNALMRNIVEGGFTGPVHPINPAADEILGRPAYPSVAVVPGTADLAVVAVSPERIDEVVEDCAAKGVHGLVVVSAGFAEEGPEGATRQRRLVEVARRHGMRVIGPNCLGIVNTDPEISLNATFAAAVPAAGRVGVLSQSGAVGIALLDAAARTGVGVSTFVSAGNKADVSGNDLLQYWQDDPRTDVVLLYLESFGNPRKFSRIARRLGRTKPIVAVKSGRTAAGTRAASSHTAAMASTDVAVDALFRQAGVIRVDTVDEMLDVGRVLAIQPLPAGRRIAVVGNSGGPGIMAADAATTARLELPELTGDTQARLRSFLPPSAAVANPVDLLASGGPAEYESAVAAVLADEQVDLAVVVFTPTLVADPAEVGRAIVRAGSSTEKPVVAAFIAGEAGVLDTGEGQRAVPVFTAAEEAVLALGRIADHADWRRRPPGTVPSLSGIDDAAARRLIHTTLAESSAGRWLDADQAVGLLQAYGVPVVPTLRARSEREAVEAAEQVGFPVALKTAAGDVVHKTETGGVALGLSSGQAVVDAWRGMATSLGSAGAVVQPMAAPGVETIVGITQDPQFGPLVLFGLGGTAAELLGDRVVRLVPLTDLDAAELVRSLRASPLLFGYRGAAPVDSDALEDLLLRVARLAEELPEVAELDLNPVIASASGVTGVDAKVRLAPAAPSRPDVRHLAPPRPR